MSSKDEEAKQESSCIKDSKEENEFIDFLFDTDDECKDKNQNKKLSSRLSYVLTEEERLKLANLFIQVIHDVPPQHQIEKGAGTRTLKEREKNEFENFVAMKTGPFSRKEDKKIKKNWKTFCKLYDWDPTNTKPFLQMKYKNKVFFLNLRNRINFVQFLANGLFDRSLHSVYERFKLKYYPHNTLRYSSMEDTIILNYMQNCSSPISKRKFAELALILKRTRHSVWRRYRRLQRKYMDS